MDKLFIHSKMLSSNLNMFGKLAVTLYIFHVVNSIEECIPEKQKDFQCPDFQINCDSRFFTHENCITIPCDEVLNCNPEKFDGPFCCNNYCGGCMAVIYCNNIPVNCFQ